MGSNAERFKDLLKAGPCFGLNCAIPTMHTMEILAKSPYDFLVIDAEHPATSGSIIHTQLTALAAGEAASFVKLSSLEPNMIRHCLDLGVDGLIGADINTAEDARRFVGLTRYPPHGTRGVAGAVRATGFTRDRTYVESVEQRLIRCVLIESTSGLDQLEAICAIDGVDVVFFGPADLAAQIGHIGQAGAPAVVSAIEDGIKRVRRVGRPVGIVSAEADVDRYIKLGISMFVVGSEMTLFVQAIDSLADRLRKRYRAED
jgi:4-hydroxy-2-oxoheptanedioate aldolase